MKILAYRAESQDKLVILSCSDGQSITTDKWADLVSFLLLAPCDIAVVWNVDRFAEVFCSLIPGNIAKELNNKGKSFLENGEKLYYQFGRVFAITWAGKEVNLYPLSRYVDKELKGATELADLASRVVDAYQYFGLIPLKLTSPVAVYEPILDSLDFPRACDLPDTAMALLDKACGVMWREWREVYKLGHWQANEITDFDLVAGYPSLIAKLPDLRYARFFESKSIPDAYSWGLLDGELTITKDVTPFQNIGEWPEIITTDQLWLIQHYGLGSFKVKKGWFYQLPPRYKLPFKETMETLYHARQNENPFIKTIAKGISVGIGGKFAQRFDDGKLGDCFNSIYALLITSRCQVRVADFIWRNNLADRVVSVLVDGVLVEGDRIVLPENGGMGRWRASSPSPFLVASLLYEWGNEKKPNGQKYDEIMAMIKAKPNSGCYGNVDLNLLTHDRTFAQLPKTGRQLLTQRFSSKPQQRTVQEVS